jgi:alpha-tubulin suppressor-like RCC1 family protein
MQIRIAGGGVVSAYMLFLAACGGAPGQGSQGDRGSDGEPGATGPEGPAGPQGDPGPAGPDGPAGVDGEDGEDADTGWGPDWVLVTTGDAHACGLTSTGLIDCWLREGVPDKTGLASAPSGLFKSVSAGAASSCAIDEAGSAVCWGNNAWGQASPPTRTDLQIVLTQELISCALTDSGSAECWGYMAESSAGPYTQIALSNSATCALTDPGGEIVCWGDGSDDVLSPPAGVFTSLAGGPGHLCAVANDGSIACWGDSDSYGRYTDIPKGDFIEVTVGDSHNCALAEDGAIACWGNDVWMATDVPIGLKATQVSAGHTCTCAVRPTGSILCWGSLAPDLPYE